MSERGGTSHITSPYGDGTEDYNHSPAQEAVIGTLAHEIESPSMSGPDVTAQTFAVLRDVARERQRQDVKWGPQRHEPQWWLAVLVEEVGEAAQEVLGIRFGDGAKAHGDLRKEMLHVAAVAIAAIEAMDYGAAGLGRPGLTETPSGRDATGEPETRETCVGCGDEGRVWTGHGWLCESCDEADTELDCDGGNQRA